MGKFSRLLSLPLLEKNKQDSTDVIDMFYCNDYIFLHFTVFSVLFF